MAPTAVMPEMAFVADMSGECSAGGTPSTAWKPARPAREKTVSMAASFVSAERPITRSIIAKTEALSESAKYLRHTGGGGGGGATSAFLGASGGAYGGAGYVSSPWSSTSMPRTASSS